MRTTIRRRHLLTKMLRIPMPMPIPNAIVLILVTPWLFFKLSFRRLLLLLLRNYKPSGSWCVIFVLGFTRVIESSPSEFMTVPKTSVLPFLYITQRCGPSVRPQWEDSLTLKTQNNGWAMCRFFMAGAGVSQYKHTVKIKFGQYSEYSVDYCTVPLIALP